MDDEEAAAVKRDVNCFGAGLAVSIVQTSALTRRDAMQQKESRSSNGRASGEYKGPNVAQGAACSTSSAGQ